MTISYVDTYVSGTVQADLEVFASNFVNHTTAVQGQAAIPEDDTTTPPTPAQPAKGDPTLWYTLIRATFDITPLVSAPFAIVDPVTGASICGVYA